ncbi:MAG: hypothetical protein ACP5H2_04925 [Solirubrobacteraceae bacterium]
MNYRERTRLLNEDARVWKGGYRPYDLVKEASIAVGVVLLLALVLTVLFSSPDMKPATIKSWSRTAPADFVSTAVNELDGTSETATYGPPYDHGTAYVQHLWFIHLQQWLGVDHPINTSEDYVIAPLHTLTYDTQLQQALRTYTSASTKQQLAWDQAYSAAVGKTPGEKEATEKVEEPPSSTATVLRVSGPTMGPVPTMMDALLGFAQAGGLDGVLLANKQYYATDYTKTLMFLADSDYLADLGASQHLGGEQWGMMNETGSFPGQSWLWLYTFWYQIKPFSTSSNADIDVMAIMGVLSTLFVLVPFLPGVRDLPRKIPIYKLIWREHYRSE